MQELRKWREARGLTQDQVGLKLGVDGQFISNIERGRAGIPPERFRQLSKLLRVDISKFLRLHLKREEMQVKKLIGYKKQTSFVG